MKWHAHSFSVICPTGVFYGLAFAADKKSSRKIRYRKIPREHIIYFRRKYNHDIIETG